MTQFFSSTGENVDDEGEPMDVFNYCTTKNKDWVVKVNNVLKPYMLSILSDLVSFLESLEIKYWVTDGTALGVYREGGTMIAHDHDIDLGILEEDYLKVRRNLHLLPSYINVVGKACVVSGIDWVKDDQDVPWDGMGKKTLKLYHADVKSFALDKQPDLLWLADDHGLPIPPCKEKRIPSPRIDLSTYGYSNEEKSLVHLNWCIPGWDQSKHKIPVSSLFPLKKCVFEGINVYCPNDLKIYLTSMYGYLGRDCRYDPEIDLYRQAKAR